MEQKKIALLSCFFGKMPWYAEYFLHSCRYNSTIDFYIFSDDNSLLAKLPENVKLMPSTLEDINLLAARKLGFPVKIKSAYKLCDFKPAYGLIFADLLQSYDFWGYTDLDIIFGDIRAFFDDRLLNQYEIISCRADWLTGCFLLYKNTRKLNTLFTRSRDYKMVLSAETHYCFDETNFAHKEFSEGKTYREAKTEIESMMHVVQKMTEEKKLKVSFDHYIIEGCPGKLAWDNGKMFYRNKYEILLYHLIFFKKRYHPERVRAIPGKFKISPSRIYHRAH